MSRSLGLQELTPLCWTQRTKPPQERKRGAGSPRSAPTVMIVGSIAIEDQQIVRGRVVGPLVWITRGTTRVVGGGRKVQHRPEREVGVHKTEATTREVVPSVSYVIRLAMGGSIVPRRKEGRAAFDVGRKVTNFRGASKAETNTSGWDTTRSLEDDDLLACSISLKETHMIGVEGAPASSRLLYYPVVVRRQATQALLDSGASVNCIDSDLADKAGGVILHKAKDVLLYPDKRHADVKGITQLEVRAKGYCEKVTFLGSKRVRDPNATWGAVATLLESKDKLANQGHDF